MSSRRPASPFSPQTSRSSRRTGSFRCCGSGVLWAVRSTTRRNDALTFLSPTASAVAGASTSAVSFGGIGLAASSPKNRASGSSASTEPVPRPRQRGFQPTSTRRPPTRSSPASSRRPSESRRLRFDENLGSVSQSGARADRQHADHRFAQRGLGCRLCRKHDQEPAGFPGRRTRRVKALPPSSPGAAPYGGPPARRVLRPQARIVRRATTTASSSFPKSSSVTRRSSVPQPTKEFSFSNILTLFAAGSACSASSTIRAGSPVQLDRGIRCTAPATIAAMHDPNTPLDQQARAVARRFTAAPPMGFISRAVSSQAPGGRGDLQLPGPCGQTRSGPPGQI